MLIDDSTPKQLFGEGAFAMRIRGKSGLTMMELMIVAVIIGLVASMVVPEFAGAVQKIRWRSMSSNMVSALRLARSSAIAKQVQHGVDIDFENRRITVFKDLVNPSSFSFDPGDSVVSVDSIATELDYLFVTPSNRAICFLPNGRAADWVYIMGSKFSGDLYQTVSISVLPATGRVSIEYLES